MNGTNSDFTKTYGRENIHLARKRTPQIWPRRINLNPMGAKLPSKNGTRTKRRQLVISSFFAVNFTVRWKPTDEPKTTSGVDCEDGAARSESLRLFCISE